VDWTLASGPSVRFGDLVIMLVLLSAYMMEHVSINVESDTCTICHGDGYALLRLN
jgi:syntaxin-binding protein 5